MIIKVTGPEFKEAGWDWGVRCASIGYGAYGTAGTRKEAERVMVRAAQRCVELWCEV